MTVECFWIKITVALGDNKIPSAVLYPHATTRSNHFQKSCHELFYTPFKMLNVFCNSCWIILMLACFRCDSCWLHLKFCCKCIFIVCNSFFTVTFWLTYLHTRKSPGNWEIESVENHQSMGKLMFISLWNLFYVLCFSYAAIFGEGIWMFIWHNIQTTGVQVN